jgi:protein-tyrosine phosphatase
VHCKAGKSRSVTIVLAHLIKTEKIHLNEAYEDVRSKRGVIEPNLAFMGTLLLIEREVFGEGNMSAIGEPIKREN